jgi:hypothetical protein
MTHDKIGDARMANELIADLFVSLDDFAAGVEVGPYFGYAGPELDGWREVPRTL